MASIESPPDGTAKTSDVPNVSALDSTSISKQEQSEKNSFTSEMSSTSPFITTEQLVFQPPEECLVFKPSEEEFKNAPSYIRKIRPIAEKCGIVKIIPPESWMPPCTVDVDNFKFTPIVQRLNEMDALSRVKLNFLEKIAKFWVMMQGTSMKIPLVEKKPLDLYSLKRIVQEGGGFDRTTKERRWSRVAQLMNFSANTGHALKNHYERLLKPFDIFASKAVIKLKEEFDPENVASTSTAASGLQTAPTHIKTEDEKNDKTIKVFGGKHGVMRDLRRRLSSVPHEKSNRFPEFRCYNCNRTDMEEVMIICNECLDGYHTFCLMPPLNDVPCGAWRCPRCIMEGLNKPIIGSEDIPYTLYQREYTMRQFIEMADQFKREYFRQPEHLVSTEMVEREFWRIVSSVNDDFVVEYGADLNTIDHRSGFPTKNSLKLRPEDIQYIDSSWNLNNLPIMEESALSYITAGISDVEVPCLHVGMCFSTICWHLEDHWSYSINYLHWGQPKTWYGIPSSHAKMFESVLKDKAPELFELQPNLLHQLVTILNPNILMEKGIPVYRTDQRAGEFVITFPRAYHAGFNQGLNFAESVNYAPADWLRMGRDCVRHYSKSRRNCVFSHDELICKMALVPEKLSVGMASECYLQLTEMLVNENNLRKIVQEQGTTKVEHRPLEVVADDERQCKVCKTACFLSAVSCHCTKQIVCLQHHSELCRCNPKVHCLLYRYTINEITVMAQGLEAKAKNYKNWLVQCRDVVDPQNAQNKISLEDLQELVNEAKENKYPTSILLDRLITNVTAAEKCLKIIQMLDLNKVRTRTNSTKYKLTIPELELFVEEIDNLLCTLKGSRSVRELLALSKKFVTASKELLSKKVNKVDEKSIEKQIDEGLLLSVELREIDFLRDRLDQVNWYNRSHRFHNAVTKFQPTELHRFINEGMALMPEPIIEKEIAGLQHIEISIESWEIAAKACLQESSQLDLSEIEWLLRAADKIHTEVPSKATLREALKKAKDWLNSVEIMQQSEYYPYYHSVEAVLNKAISIPLRLDYQCNLNKHLDAAREWKEKTSKIFLLKRSQFTLLDVLSPRTSALMTGNSIRPSLEEQFTDDVSPAQIVDAFKKAEEKEIRDMRELRQINTMKSPLEDKFCVCKGKFAGTMYICKLCLNWFHEGCVRSYIGKETTNASQESASIKSTKFLCQSCLRSRRPRLAAILPLLLSLNRLPIRLPEGEALQCLTERAMDWQDRARQAFATEDVAAALAALSTQKKLDSKHTIETISMRVGDEELSDSDLTEWDANDDSSNEEFSNMNLPRSECEDDAQQNYERATTVDVEQHTTDDVHCVQMKETADNDAANEIEHAYSVPIVPSSSTQTAAVVSESATKSQHSTDPSASPVVIELKRSTRDLLQSLKLEGDLLEVSVDETKKLWKLLNMKSTCSDLTPVEEMYKIFPAIQEETSTGRPMKKRRMMTCSGNVSLKRRRKGGKALRSLKRYKDDATEAEDTNHGTPHGRPSLGTSNIRKRKRAYALTRNKLLADKKAIFENDEEQCHAINCHKPTGREVDWVQCDGGCDLWFHMFCVGLDRRQVNPDDDFLCVRCKAKRSSPSKDLSSSSIPEILHLTPPRGQSQVFPSSPTYSTSYSS